MALIGNYSVLNKTAGRFISGAIYAQTRANFGKSGSLRNSNTHFGSLAAIPSGYYGGYAWSMPIKVGAMSSFTQSYSTISTYANMVGGYNLEGSSTLDIINTNADLGRVISMEGSSSVSISGSASISAALYMEASSSVSIAGSANMTAIAEFIASAIASITSTNATMTALAHLEAAAGGPEPLSPEGLAQAVWYSLSADNNAPNTMASLIKGLDLELKKKLNTSLFIAEN